MNLKSILTIPRPIIESIKIDRSKAANIALAALVILAVLGMIFYFIKTDRIGGDFLAGLFVGISEEVDEESDTPLEEEIFEGFYIEEALAGEGLTHIARRVLDQHLSEQGNNLDAERRVFVEDYVQKTLGGEDLYLGEEVSISRELISEAINLSFSLEAKQLENLKNYSSLVSSFN